MSMTTNYDLRKAALDAAVMHHDTASTEEAVIASAVKFEAYLRNGVKTEADAAGDDENCTCPICILRRALQAQIDEKTDPDQDSSAPAEDAQTEQGEPAETPAG